MIHFSLQPGPVLMSLMPVAFLLQAPACRRVVLGSMAVSRLGRAGRTLVGLSRATIPAGAFAARFAEGPAGGSAGVARVTPATVVRASAAGEQGRCAGILGPGSGRPARCPCRNRPGVMAG
jgi:hypothetical protein